MQTYRSRLKAQTSHFPPLPGEICEQYIRCGKVGCRCEQGKRHGPYYYRIWREGEQVHKVYVKRTDLEMIQQACNAYRNYQQMLRETRRQREILSQSIHRQWRKAQSLLRETK